MTKLETLRKKYQDARAEHKDIMLGGYDDMICREAERMMHATQADLSEYLKLTACTDHTRRD